MEKWSYQADMLKDFQVANHGYEHINNWRTSPRKQRENIQRVEDKFPDIEKNITDLMVYLLTITQVLYCYGRLGIKMWTLMTYDFNHDKSQYASMEENTIRLEKKRSILVFHDNKKSSKHTRWLLNRSLLEIDKLSKETQVYDGQLVVNDSARGGTRTRTFIRTHGPQPCLSTSFSTRADGQIYQISLSEKGFKAIVTPYKEKQAQANT